jgi:hypothetical protein
MKTIGPLMRTLLLDRRLAIAHRVGQNRGGSPWGTKGLTA